MVRADLGTRLSPNINACWSACAANLSIAKIEPWDLEFYFSHFTNELESQKFSTEDGWTKAKELTAGLGYNLDPVEMHVADLSFGGAAYPVLYGREVKTFGKPILRNLLL